MVLAIVFLSPVFGLLSVWTKLVSRGPVLYRQERVGLRGTTFHVYKFRTMHQGAEASGAVTLKDDDRLVRGARLIRKLKLDELPQLLNVLQGTMALVGPRPTVREDYERMDPEQRERFSVRPGLTGLAQISGNTSLPWPQRIELDLAYIRSRNLRTDLSIIVRTVSLVLSGNADTHPPTSDEWAES